MTMAKIAKRAGLFWILVAMPWAVSGEDRQTTADVSGDDRFGVLELRAPYHLEHSALSGRATIAFRDVFSNALTDKLQAEQDEELRVLVRFEPNESGHFYNPNFHFWIPMPGYLAVFDAEKRYLGFWPNISFDSLKRAQERSWYFVPKGGYAGTSIPVIAGRQPCLPRSKRIAGVDKLPPGKYYLQLIYFESFVLPVGDVREVYNVKPEVCRSNVLELDVSEKRAAPAATVRVPAAADETGNARKKTQNEFRISKAGKFAFWPQYVLKIGGEIGSSREILFQTGELEFARTITAAQGSPVTIDVQAPAVGGGEFYNPFFDDDILPPAHLVIYDAQKQYLGTIDPCCRETSRRDPVSGDWIRIGGYAGTTRQVIAGRMPGLRSDAFRGDPDADYLPPGKYYLQLIYLQRYVTRPDSPLEAVRAATDELLRSNVLELELTEPASDEKLPKPECSCGRAAARVDRAGGKRPDLVRSSNASAVRPALGGAYIGATGAPAKQPEPAAKERIGNRLSQQSEVEFIDRPLKDALEQLSDRHGIPIVIDTAGLQAADVSPETLTTLKVSAVSLESVLNLILEPLGLDWTITDDVLLVTTAQRVAAHYDVRIVSVAELVESGLSPADIRQAIMDTIEPATWADTSDPATIRVLPENRLMILHNRHVLARIDRLLGELAAVFSGGDVPRAPAAERHIIRELRALSQTDFYETPLWHCLEYLEELHGIQIDSRALKAHGIPSHSLPITLSLTGVSLQSALNAMLKPLGLRAVVDHEVLIITSEAAAAAKRQTGVYDLRRLGEAGLDPEELLQLVRAIAVSGSPAEGSAARLSMALILTHSQETHRLVEDLLAELLRKHRLHGLALEQEDQSAQMRLRQALKRKAAFEFVDRPLHKMIDVLQATHEIPVALDEPALAIEFLSRHTAVSSLHPDLPMASALNLLLRPHNLQWIVEDEVLKITTAAKASRTPSWQVYEVSDLAQENLPTRELAQIVRESINSTDAGNTDVNPRVFPINALLVVRQSPINQRRIAALLNELRQSLNADVRRGETD
jgi:hypothetical protein